MTFVRARDGHARWTNVASSTALALIVALSGCSGDDDDAADNDTGTDTETESAEGQDEGEDAGTEASEGQDQGDAAGTAEVAALQAQLDEANTTIEEDQAQITELTAQVATADAATAEAQAQLADETTRADDAEAQLTDLQTQVDAFTSTFPVTISTSLVGEDLVGSYTMSLSEAYCAGLPTCGAARPNVTADIVQGPNGLELQVPTVLTAGLFAIEGALFAVTGSNLIVPACNGVAHDSQVSVTIFADAVIIDEDGTKDATDLGASLMVSAPPTATGCGEGDVFFQSTLTPT